MQIDFSIDNVKRHWKWFVQRWTRGFDNRELWNLDHTIAKFVLPRLKAFRHIGEDGPISHPCDTTPELWNEILDDMIYAMEIAAAENEPDDVDWDRVEKGNLSFGSYFRDLWD